WNAGATPNSRAVVMPALAVNSNTRQSSERSRKTVVLLVESWAAKTRLPQKAIANATGVAVLASTMVSIRSCRTRRQREAPRASRTLNSWRRAIPRASIKFATFAQAMRSTSATTTITVTSGRVYSWRKYDVPVDAGSRTKDSVRYFSRYSARRFPGTVASQI